MRQNPTPARGDAVRALVARWYLVHHTGLGQETVRERCEPVACDVRNRSLLYDVEAALVALAAVVTRRSSKPIRQTVKSSGTLAAHPACPDSGTVFYVRVGAHIVIGHTDGDLAARLDTYGPTARILAVEAGTPHVLQARYDRFVATWDDGERFHPSMDLIAHINSLRATPLSPAELAAI